MCFVWISEHTVTTTLYCTFITETNCVYCAVRTEYLNTIQVHFRLQTVNCSYIEKFSLITFRMVCIYDKRNTELDWTYAYLFMCQYRKSRK